MPCPRKVDIPGTFSAYNKYYTDSKFVGLKEYLMCTGLRNDMTSPANCIECGKCEKICPQHLPIRNNLKLVASQFGG
jgi:predicted aldo/keto reductase-like oxidoreductase